MSTSSPRHWVVKTPYSPLAAGPPGMQPVPPWQRARNEPKGLRFTELLFLFALAIAYFETISEPIFGIQLHQTPLKYLPLILLTPAFVLHFIGVLFNRGTGIWSRSVGAIWPMLLLAIYILCGSLWAKYEDGSGTTFITLGVYIGLLPLYVAMTVEGKRVGAWTTGMAILWIGTSISAFAAFLAHPGYIESLHEIEYVVASGFFLLYYTTSSRIIKLIAVAALLAAVIMNHKLTGYICGAAAVMHIVVSAGWHRLKPNWRGFYGTSALVACIVLVAILTLLYFEFRKYLPSGSSDVRMAQYEQAWNQFVDSPIWGAAYTQGSGENFMQNGRSLYIPTHSDILDLLKHGGLIAFALFAAGYWRMFRIINGAVGITSESRSLNAYFVAARYFMVMALVSFAVNPLLLKGPYVVVIWGNLGLAVGMALAVKGQAQARTRAPKPAT